MVGTISGLGLSQQIGSDGKPLAGWRLSIFEANTSTPVNVYKDFGLSLLHPHPIEADANGRLPMFWLEDNAYRVRGTDAAASTILFDEDSIQAIGPSTGEAPEGSAIDPNAVASTGDIKWRASTGTLSGWVRANGRTIGSATSGAAERANADTEDLFTYLWNSFSDTICPVTGGRGDNAAADWASNKPIAVIDLRGCVIAGVDDMGNDPASRITSATITNPTTGGSRGGAQTHLLTTGESGQKAISSAPVTINDPTHDHLSIGKNSNFGWSVAGPTQDGVISNNNSVPSRNTTAKSTGITASFTLAGSSAVSAHNNMQPTMLGSFYIRL